MADTDSPVEPPPIHYRSLFLFFGYLSLITSLALLCIRTISVRYQARQRKNDWVPFRKSQLPIFLILAALSLGSTWYYMISFFVWSYRDWAGGPKGVSYTTPNPIAGGSAEPLPLLTKMGLWLNNTYTFQQAWETVSIGNTRVWWSAQIFGWTIGWSLFLGITGRRHRIPHVWIYMLLAQAVGVSFAANLFFAAITVSSRVDEKDINYSWTPNVLVEFIPVALSLLDTLAVPLYAYREGFMLILLAPHFLVFIPAILGPSPSAPVQAKATNPAAKKHGHLATQRYVTGMQLVAAAAVALQGYFTYLAVQDIGTDLPYIEIAKRLWDAVYEHPACSSVSWDVIMCTISAFFWAGVNGFDTGKMLGEV
ncbi:hypothetical protein BDV19DRAFT_358040 [Aspergillus venezuelensis]